MNLKKEHIEEMVRRALVNRDDLFVLDIHVGRQSDIVVTLDGDTGVTLGDCAMVNRFLENELETSGKNFSIRVEGPDITQPFSHPRQYLKNIGRTLIVKTQEKSYTGTLDNFQDRKLYLSRKSREPKPVGKGKQTVIIRDIIPLEDVVETKVKITFH